MNPRALILIGMQREYTNPGRPWRIQGIAPSLGRAAFLLANARHLAWPIIHVRHAPAVGMFGAEGRLGDFIEGFAPRHGETVIAVGEPSCFSTPLFGELLEDLRQHEICVAGYASDRALLATVVEGFHRGHWFHVMRDASAATGTGLAGEAQRHAAACELMGSFATIGSSRGLMAPPRAASS